MKLYKHQEEALERTKTFNKCAYYHDMGLGKTFTGSEKMRMLDDNVNLIICQKSKVGDWIKHCEETHLIKLLYGYINIIHLITHMIWRYSRFL